MNAHGIVGSNGSVDKGPVRVVLVDLHLLLKGLVTLPEIEQFSFLRGVVDFVWYIFKGHLFLHLRPQANIAGANS